MSIVRELPCPKCQGRCWAHEIYRTHWIDIRGNKWAQMIPTNQYTPNYWCSNCKEWVIGGRPVERISEEERQEMIKNITHNLEKCREAIEVAKLCDDIEKAINEEEI